MGLVLQYISDSSDSKVKVYDSQKRFIEDGELDTFGEFDDHKWIEQPKDKSQLYAEDKPSKSSQIEIKAKEIAQRKDKSRFKYFLDGTRHVYKVGDIAIDGTVYPLAVGQIIVGYCGREGRDIKIGRFNRILVLAAPIEWNVNHQGENFFHRQCEEINKRLQKTPLFQKFGIQFNYVIPCGSPEQSFTKSLNNDSSNIIIINPSFHRIIHQCNPVFNINDLQFEFPNGVIEKLKLNKHLRL